MATTNYIVQLYPSPLRYPGGKSCLSRFFEEILTNNSILNGVYCEGFAGGAGAALNLLYKKKVGKLVLNDADIHISSLWNSILKNSNEFLQLLKHCPIDLDEWYYQREIYNNPKNYSELEIGFSTFFLNRANRGGILPNAGPTGGYNQTGNFKIDARFKKENLVPRVKEISKYKDSIEFFSLDARVFINEVASQLNPSDSLIYLDPPYYHQGKNLYLNFYEHADHVKLSQLIGLQENSNWIVSYDNTPEILALYKNFRHCAFDINYSVQKSRQGKEIMFFSNGLVVPEYLQIAKRQYVILEN